MVGGETNNPTAVDVQTDGSRQTREPLPDMVEVEIFFQQSDPPFDPWTNARGTGSIHRITG